MDLLLGWVKYWRITFISPNSPKFSPATVLRYTIFDNAGILLGDGVPIDNDGRVFNDGDDGVFDSDGRVFNDGGDGVFDNAGILLGDKSIH